jgi:pyrophosphatase PpaX
LNFAGVLFDLDGTLLDTSGLIIKSFQHTFKVHYQREVKAADVYPFFGKTLRAAMEVLGPDKVDDLIATYREFNLAKHDELTTAFTGVVEVVQSLYSAGIKMGVVTSKTRGTALRGLRLFDMDKYFLTVVGADECTKHKPDPEPVERALKTLELSWQQCLMVGDSPSDIISAQQAGTKTAAVKWTHVPWTTISAAHPDYILETMDDLLPICGIAARK